MTSRAFVIIDVANFRMAIARQLGQGRQADLKLEKLVQLLRQYDYETSGIAVAMPTQLAQRYPYANADSANDVQSSLSRLKSYVDELNVWRSRETQWLFNKGASFGLKFRTLETLPGCIDEDGEIGVDDLIVTRALVAAEEIRRDASRSGEEVLVLSHDTDLLHLSQYADDVPLRVVGLDETLRATHGRGDVNWIGWSSEEMKALASSRPIPRRRGNPPILNTTSVPPPLVESRVSVVVDAYGIACSGAAALNLAELPDGHSVRQCLLDLRIARDVADLQSLTFVVPDVHVDRPPRDGGQSLSKFERTAWNARDKQLDELSRQLEVDGELGTNVVRGTLAPAHMPAANRIDSRRLDVQQYIKRYSTLITAATVRECLRSSADDVVVFTDSPDVITALDYLLAVKKHLLGSKRLLRIGVRAEPLTPPKSRAAFKVPYFVLTSVRLAKLLRLTGLSGRSLRTAVAGSAASLGNGTWQVVGLEPEVGGVRVRSVTSAQVELVIFDAAKLGLGLNQEFSAAKMQLQVSIDPAQPVDVLVFQAQAAGRVRQRSAVVVGRDASGVTFDYEDDGVPDGSVHLGHDFSSVDHRGKIVVGVVDESKHRYMYLSDNHGSERREERAIVVDAGASIRVSVGGSIFEAEPIQTSDLGDLKSGDSIAVIDVGSEHEARYVVISSALGDSPIVSSS
jgi:hypothetical protein